MRGLPRVVLVVCAVLIAVAIPSCNGITCACTPPINIAGTFLGNYTGTANPGVVYQAVLQLGQSEATVSGTFTSSSAGRSANVSGSVSGTRLTVDLTFTDVCSGTASATADITNNGSKLTGTYTANDCIGSYSGQFAYDRRDLQLEALYAKADSAIGYANSALQASLDRQDSIRVVLNALIACENDRFLACMHNPSRDSVNSFINGLMASFNLVSQTGYEISDLKSRYAGHSVSRVQLIQEVNGLVNQLLGIGNTYVAYFAAQDSTLIRFNQYLQECQVPFQTYSCH